MTITVSTQKLIDVLTDALHLADYRGVHLSSHRGPWREEPGNVDLLAFTSGCLSVLGHTWIPVEGDLRAAVWPVQAATTVKSLCTSWIKGGGKDNHTVELDMVLADPPPNAKEGEHPGWVVTLSETPTLIPSDNEFQFHAHHEGKVPIRTWQRVLAPPAGLPFEEVTDDDEVVPSDVEAALTLWGPGVLSPLVKVASRRGMTVQLFRSQFRRTQVVQIGDTWIGAAWPYKPLPGEHGVEPSIEPVFTELVGAE